MRADRNSRDGRPGRRHSPTSSADVETSRRLHRGCIAAHSRCRTAPAGAQRPALIRRSGERRYRARTILANCKCGKEQTVRNVILASGSCAVIGGEFGHRVSERRVIREALAHETEFARVSEGIPDERANRAKGRRRSTEAPVSGTDSPASNRNRILPAALGGRGPASHRRQAQESDSRPASAGGQWLKPRLESPEPGLRSGETGACRTAARTAERLRAPIRHTCVRVEIRLPIDQ